MTDGKRYGVVKHVTTNGTRTAMYARLVAGGVRWTVERLKVTVLTAIDAIELAEANYCDGAYVPAAFASWSRLPDDLLARAKRLEDNASDLTVNV